MALIECHECRKEISDQAKACPGCGAKAPSEPKSYAWLWTILILFGFFVWYAVASNSTPQARAMREDQMTYELCLQDVKKFPGNPIVAGACELIREKFIAKYNREP